MSGLSKKSFYDIGKNLTDKIYHHRYDRYYPIFIDKFRDKEFNLLEIGIKDSNSIKLWEEYFPLAQIYGIDINISYSKDRVNVYRLDQSSDNDLDKALSIIPKCDIIIDDGSHVPEHQLKTFKKLFDNLLNYGGVYIIEDIECSYWKKESIVYGYRLKEFSIFSYFHDIIDQINSEFSNKENIHNISYITFAYNSIIITKQTIEEINFSKRTYRYKNNLP